ncbi:hypothetical protein SAMN05444266_10578 [Chitinophaga jiangningensis]|uniref:Uncharacterized protein n=1 Tax=Chitinophaga jiangningensis TaxID=1419482 RepID=A0A1M7DPM1_9BACT|nr:hypothetical protein [Chitinophaga jiangningensis]SHL81347.1 hypothetical protein SAMN05444266_10578 [Chitinophaga jiangningensis]
MRRIKQTFTAWPLSYFADTLILNTGLTKDLKKLILTPSAIYKMALEANLDTQFLEIEYWEDFENGRLDFGIQDFFILIKKFECFGHRDMILIVTNELFMRNQCLEFYLDEFNEFAQWYES